MKKNDLFSKIIIIGVVLAELASIWFIYNQKDADTSKLSGVAGKIAYDFVFNLLLTPLGLVLFAFAAILASLHLYIANHQKGEGFRAFLKRYFK